MKLSLDQYKRNAILADFKNNTQAVLALAAFIFVLDVIFIFRWQFVSLGRLFKEVNQLSQEVKNTRVDSKLTSTYKTKLDDLNEELVALKKMIVAEENLPSVIESVQKFANLSGVRVLSIKPLAAGNVAPAADSANKDSKILREKISILIRCGFHQLGRFIALLENAPVFLDIVNLEIRTDDQDYMMQSVTIVLEVAVRNV